ncbi:LCP family protein [Acetobacterium sp.]|uniref:LCP family protein n=1 Tax=Acetobacterium sp. TaxID=1872094 RepID=UPI002F3F90C0
MSKKSSTMKKILIPLFIVIILAASGFYYVYSTYLGKINTVKITKNEEELQIQPVVADKSKDIINIALFGIDTRADDYDGSRTDSIIIASLDLSHKKLKLSSIMRDSFVSIPGEKYDKINHAYEVGGPELTVKTLNENFDMNIKDYMTVNFSALEEIVDAVGGVEINVKDYEVDLLNKTSGSSSVGTGVQTLDGQQALAYSRIRYSGDADYERTLRQRTVLQSVINNVLKSKSLPQALSLIEILSPYVQTSLDQGALIGLGTKVFSAGGITMEDTRLPVDGQYIPGVWDEVFYLKYDTLSENVSYLHDFIYEEKGYVPSPAVEEISNTILSTVSKN